MEWQLGDSPPYDNYTLIYQGGHHNVYCDGSRHIQTEGGWCWEDKNKQDVITTAVQWRLRKGLSILKCDCAEWAKYKAGDRSTPPIFDNMKINTWQAG